MCERGFSIAASEFNHFPADRLRRRHLLECEAPACSPWETAERDGNTSGHSSSTCCGHAALDRRATRPPALPDYHGAGRLGDQPRAAPAARGGQARAAHDPLPAAAALLSGVADFV